MLFYGTSVMFRMMFNASKITFHARKRILTENVLAWRDGRFAIKLSQRNWGFTNAENWTKRLTGRSKGQKTKRSQIAS